MRRFSDGILPDDPLGTLPATIRCALAQTAPTILRGDCLTSIWCRCNPVRELEKAFESRADSQIDIKQNRLLVPDSFSVCGRPATRRGPHWGMSKLLDMSGATESESEVHGTRALREERADPQSIGRPLQGASKRPHLVYA